MDLPKLHPNERVDLGDMEFLSLGVLGEFQRTLVDVVTGDAVKRVLDGFAFSIQSTSVLRITFGKAILAENRNASIHYGQLVGGGLPLEGVASQDISFAGRATSPVWGVYVRFAYGDGALANRAFWDVPTALETIQAVNTRQVATWQVTAAQTDPGADWYKVCSVLWNGTNLNTSTLTDTRAFLFEGPADSTPQTFRPTWGGGSDRNANRSANGVKTLERFASAVLKKIEEIQSSTASVRWWDAPVEALDRKVSQFGQTGLAGDYIPDVSGRDLGSVSNTWDVWAGTVSVATGISLGGDITPVVTRTPNLGSASLRFNTLNAARVNIDPGVTGSADIVELFQNTASGHTGTHYLRMRTALAAPNDEYIDFGVFGAGGTAFVDVGEDVGFALRRKNGSTGSGDRIALSFPSRSTDLNPTLYCHQKLLPFVDDDATNTFGSSSFRWKGHLTTATIYTLLRPAVDLGSDIGFPAVLALPGGWFNDAYVGRVLTKGIVDAAANIDLTARTQINNIVATGHFIPQGATGTVPVPANSWNVASITKVSVGHYRVIFKFAVLGADVAHPINSVGVSVGMDSSAFASDLLLMEHAPVVTHAWDSPTQLSIYLGSLFTSPPLLSETSMAHVSFSVMGHPATLQS